MIIWNKKLAILFIYFVFLHTNKDKNENCCYTLKVIIGIKYIKNYDWY